jgi:hypothetical protein
MTMNQHSPTYHQASEAQTSPRSQESAREKDTSPALVRLAERSQLLRRWRELALRLEAQAIAATSRSSPTDGGT